MGLDSSGDTDGSFYYEYNAAAVGREVSLDDLM